MFRLVNGGELLPQRATRFSAGFDVFAREDAVIAAGETKVIGLGICIDTPLLAESHYFELHPRSSLRAKGLGGGVGIIDMDYRDELKMVINNPISMDALDSALRVFHVGMKATTRSISDKRVEEEMCSFLESRKDKLGTVSIKRGDKIGQLILKRHEGGLLPAEYTLDIERNGGFGSTDFSDFDENRDHVTITPGGFGSING